MLEVALILAKICKNYGGSRRIDKGQEPRAGQAPESLRSQHFLVKLSCVTLYRHVKVIFSCPIRCLFAN